MNMSARMNLVWNKIRCKKCGAILTPQKGSGLTNMEVLIFVVHHIVACGDLFELTLKPEIKKDNK